MTARFRLRTLARAVTPLVAVAMTAGGFATPWAASATTAHTVAAISSFPSAATTGWAHTGVHLTHRRGMTVKRDGTVIDRADIAGNLVIHANNVTVRRSRITAGGFWPVTVDPHFTGFTMVDTQIVGVQTAKNMCKVGFIGSNSRLVRVDISNCEDGVHPGNRFSIRDSYIHNLWLGTDAAGVRVVQTHNDGIQVMGGHHITIRHNTILTGHNENSAVFLKADFGPISRVLVTGNYVDGGCFSVFGQDAAGGTVTNITVTGNVFGPSFVFGRLVTSRWTGPVVVSGNANTKLLAH